MTKYLDKTEDGKKLTATHEDFIEWIKHHKACRQRLWAAEDACSTFVSAWENTPFSSDRDFLANTLRHDGVIDRALELKIYNATHNEQKTLLDPHSIGFYDSERDD